MKKIFIIFIIITSIITSIEISLSFDNSLKEDYLYNKIENSKEGLSKESIKKIDKLLIKINTKKNTYSETKYTSYIDGLEGIINNFKIKYKNNKSILDILNYISDNIGLINKDIYSKINFKDTSININDKLEDERVIIEYGEEKIVAFINKPKGDTFDVVMIFHGTTAQDDRSEKAAKKFSTDLGKKITDEKGLLTISIAYKETDRPIGDELKESKSALLWLQNEAKYKNLNVGKIYLLGHSRGGFIVHHLNTLYKTDGVIANGAGPINFPYTCTKGRDTAVKMCELVEKDFGTVNQNPEEFRKRSVLRYIDDSKSKMLIIQGTEDGDSHMKNFPLLKDRLNKCTNCPPYKIVMLEGIEHYTFDEEKTWEEIYDFID